MKKNKVFFHVIFICFFLIKITNLFGQEIVRTYTGEAYRDFTSDGAWCWFADPRAVYFKGENEKIYACWVDSEGNVKAASFDLKSGEMAELIIHHHFNRDDHANPSLLILPGGRIMIFYSAHGGRQMFYRLSKNPEDITEWGELKTLQNTEGPRGFTYPNPVLLSGENNRIYLFWRGGNFKPTFSYTDDNENWSEPETLIQSDENTYVRPYVKVCSNGKDKIHFAFTDGHPRDEPYNSIYYACYRNGAFYRADGSKIAGMNELPVSHEKSDKVYDGRRTRIRSWIWDIAVDEKGYPVIVYTRLPEETDHRYHYARWDGKKWQDFEITIAGKWFPETPGGYNEPEPHYSGGIVLDHTNPSILYLSREVKGVFEIQKWVTENFGISWKVSPVTSNSNHDNVRPFAVRNVPTGTKPSVLWMNNRKYRHYLDYNASIKMDIPNEMISGELKPESVFKIMKRAADWHIDNPGSHRTTDWTYGALMTGMLSWGLTADSDKYLNYLKGLGEQNNWQPGGRIYHADDHCVGWTYLGLYDLFGNNSMLNPVRTRFDSILVNPSNAELKIGTPGCFNRWCWCDALFMSPPVWAKLASITGDKKYLDFMHREFRATADYLYDRDEHLFFRDSRYFDKREANGKKIFWSRGNGWVIAGIARILQSMPEDCPERPGYIKIFKEMAAKLLQIQPENGLWRASLLDPGSYPVPETSGSGFFTYALAWGINRGLLNKADYLPAVKKAWKGLVESVHPDGKLGYVQPIGEDPRKVTEDMTEIYGVGAFLLTGSEVYKIALFEDSKKAVVKIQNPVTIFRDNETVSLNLNVIKEQISLKSGQEICVFDCKHNRFLITQLIDNNQDGKPDEILFQSDFGPGEKKTFWIVPKKREYPIPETKARAFGMFVPERKDDFAWENDRIAFRMYGPALEESGEISSGVDVWTKKVSYPVLKKWYRINDYHTDIGEGLDFYTVGSSRGCGGTGIYRDGKLYVSKNFTDWKITANGPIRTVFELKYAPWDAGGRTVREVKRISLDLGSNLSRFESRFEVLSGDKKLPAAAGIVKRGNAGVVSYNLNNGWMGYLQPEDKINGTIGCGVVMYPDSEISFIDGLEHGFFVTNVSGDNPLIYYSGACWDKAQRFKTRSEWENYLENFAERIKNPLIIKY